MHRKLLFFCLLALAPALVAAPERWAAEIDAYTNADKLTPPPAHPIVFVGSSSIRLWKTLAADFPSLPVINRGFGGSHLGDSVTYADRIVLPYGPKLVVLYSGENDITAGKTPESVYEAFKAFVAKVHAANPKTPIIYLSLKPSPSRWKFREAMMRANALIKAECAQDKRVTFVDVWSPMLNEKGEPRRELFVKDMLHMNADGYALWTQLLMPIMRLEARGG